MVAQGTDGVSRGNLREGVAVGETIMFFCPWAKSALKVNSQLWAWVKLWASDDIEVLEPNDWFERGHAISCGYRDGAGDWYAKFKNGSSL